MRVIPVNQRIRYYTSFPAFALTVFYSFLIRFVRADDLFDSGCIVVGIEDLVEPGIPLLLVQELDQVRDVDGVVLLCAVVKRE